MHDRFQALRIACRPFLTRALRGPRRRRFVGAAAVLTALVVLVGAWVGLSPSHSAHDMRVSLELEEYRWDREHTEFVVFADSALEREQILTQGVDHDAALRRYGRLRARTEEAWLVLDMVSGPYVVAPARDQALQDHARALRDARIDLAPDDLEERRRYTHFDWNDPRDRQQLQAIVDAQLEPRVEVYRSPLDGADTIRLIGLLGGGLLLVLLTVGAPLWVGVRLAQELHENTLQPLTGTALTARQLVVGLAAGSLAPVAIAAAPLGLLTLGTAAGAGRLVPALGFMLAMLAMSAMLVGLAMLGALAVGRQRAPGIVGIGLLALLGLVGLAGLAAGLNLDANTLGMVTIVPGAGPVHLLTEAFNPVAHLDADRAAALDLRLLLATAGAVGLAAIMGRALERWVGGTHQDGALRPVEAAVAALVLSVLAMTTMPARVGFGETFFWGTALVLVPLQLVLMGRVPGTDVPARL
ncbi:MAG: hypothetical protein KDK70_40380, partial [Myxococcales bacterium]|nr:hypothetical protein [Myxococcales bacterium]